MDLGPYAKRVVGFAISVIIFLVAMGSWYLSPRGVSVDCEIKQTDSRVVEQSTLPVRELRAVSGIHPLNLSDRILLVSTANLVIAADNGCNRVVALQPETGEVVWEKGELFTAHNLTLDETHQRIYVSATQNITALSVTEGEVVWSNSSESFIRNAHPVVLHDDGQLTVETNEDWAIDPDSSELSPADISSESTALQDELADRVHAIIGDPSIASNIVTSDEITFVMDENATLHLLDLAESTALGNVVFTPPQPTELLYAPGAIGGSGLAVTGSRVAIYFQDTGVLAVYEVDVI